MGDEFNSNVSVPPSAGAFDEYVLPEGDAVEKAQTATHKFRAKRASLIELHQELIERKLEIEFALSRIEAQLAD